MYTLRLYQQDVYLKECDSIVLDIIGDLDHMKELGGKAEKNTACLVLDQTVFFPEGGGQPCDTGFINGYPVVYVFERDSVVYHQVAVPASNAMDFFNAGEPKAPGTGVHCQIDWNRRFLHMQMHCGEHILSGMFYQEYGGVNRGFHMGADYMTLDISLEERPEYTEFTPEMVSRVELLANKAIWANVSVTTRRFDTKAEAEGLPLRKKLTIEKDISIVCVGSVENPADCVACCGTHPASSGQVGLVKITRMEHYKGMFRFYVKAGLPAFEDYCLKHDIVSALAAKHSSEPAQLLEKVKAQDEKNGAVRKELYDLKKSVIAQYAEELRLAYENGASHIVTRTYENLGSEDVQTLGRRIADSIGGLLILIAAREHTAILFSQGTPDCGKLVRENASIYQGKGGGNNTCARAIFNSKENLDTYLDLIEKHLR